MSTFKNSGLMSCPQAKFILLDFTSFFIQNHHSMLAVFGIAYLKYSLCSFIMLVAVMPAFNEEKTIRKAVFLTRKFVGKVIVVDDGSNDSTFKEAEKAGAIVLRNAVNMGKGVALKVGIKAALSIGASEVVTIDSDLQHNPAEIPLLVKALRNGSEVVFGVRRMERRMPFVKVFGNNVIKFFTLLLFGLSLSDSQCGFRAFSSNALRKIKWVSQGYAVESEMALEAARNNLKYSEVEISTLYNDSFKGTSVADGVKIVATLLWWRLTK